MSDRFCIRGCTLRGVHFAACPDFGAEKGECRGCAPSEAREGALVCQRCFQRMRRTLDSLPDVVALIRSRADPLKAAVYDREQVTGGKGSEAPAPIAADLIDAGDFVVELLRSWAGSRFAGRGITPGADAEAGYDTAIGLVSCIDLDWIANNDEAALTMWADLFDVPDDAEQWSVARAVARWPLDDRSYWAAQPCPECNYKTVKVTPPRRAKADTRYHCSTCQWEAFDRDAVDDGDGFWFEIFSRKAGKAA